MAPDFTFTQKAQVFIPTALTLTGLEMLLHAPFPLEVAFLVGAGVIANKSPEIYNAIREHIPVLPERQVKEKTDWTFTDRLFGKHMNGPYQPLAVVTAANTEQLSENNRSPLETSEQEFREQAEHLPVFPVYPEREIMRLGYVVETKQRFDPSINMLLGAGAIFAGSQGSGKSNAAGVVAEHIGKCEMSEIIFDMKREYASIRDVVPNGIVAGHPDSVGEIGGAFYPLTLENAAQFAVDVMECGYQAVMDIPSYLTYGDDWNGIARIITAIIKGLMDWSIAQAPSDRLPCLLAFDEAHIFFPQQVEMKNLFDQKVLADLNVMAFNIVNMGRSYGYTMLFSTQRIANIAKWTIGNCQIKVIMKHSVDVDLARCEEEVGKDFTTKRDIKMLATGDGYVIGLTSDPLLVHFDMRKSRHDSHTPKIDRIQKRKEKQAQAKQEPQSLRLPDTDALSTSKLSQLTVDDILVLLQSLKDVDPTDSRYEQVEEPIREQKAVDDRPAHLPRRPVSQMPVQKLQVPARKPSQALSPELQKALDAYKAGYTSCRDMAPVIDVGKTRASELIRELRDRRLI